MINSVNIQNFKSHKIKTTKRRVAQLKTLLTVRLENFEQSEGTLVSNQE